MFHSDKDFWIYMNCPHCGAVSEEVCGCDPKASASGIPRDAAEDSHESVRQDSLEGSSNEAGAWRDELSDRLNRYRARRKIPPPRYPSLLLPFEGASSIADRESPAIESSRSFEPIAESSLALDPAGPIRAREENTRPAPPAAPVKTPSNEAKTASAKIIEFPRFAWAPPPPPPDQLAEPVIDRPRILEVPEVAPSPPALGGITIEPIEPQAPEKRPGIDFPLQSASLARRACAAFMDALIVLAATSLFGLIFWKLATVRPPMTQLLGLALGLPCLCWGVYEYLLIVYSGRTPGLMAAGLELARFDGSPTSRSLRRWRILASLLSASSLGMGYAWVFLDEDALCWHDRITHTYLAPKKNSAKGD
jgi:uncharacterized RDD family membrane protein YckC